MIAQDIFQDLGDAAIKVGSIKHHGFYLDASGDGLQQDFFTLDQEKPGFLPGIALLQ